MNNKLILILLFFSLPLIFYPQQIIHRHLTIEDGLVQSNINNIYEDQEGYLWFSTMAGISRWDGINFLNFQTSDGLPAAQVYQIYGAQDSSIYFATYGGGICRYRKGRIETVFPNLTAYDKDVACIQGDEAGNFYIGGYRGIVLMDKSGQLTKIDSSRSIWSIVTGKSGNVYFGSYTNGIKILKNKHWSTLSKKDGLADNAIWNILEASEGTLYIATNSGASTWKNGVVMPMSETSELLNERVIGLLEDHNGGIYLGALSGIVYLHEGSVQKIDNRNGLSINDVWSIYEDRFGLIYFGTGGNGVDIYHPGFIENYTKESGLNDNVVRTVYVDPQNKKYFGTDMGVTIWDNGNIKYLNRKNGLAGNKVRKIIADENGTVYIGTRSGLSILKKGRLKTLKKIDGLIDDVILSLHYGIKSKNIYVCTRTGVSILRNGKLTKNYDLTSGIVDDYVNCALEDSSGDVYFGTYLGVAVLTKSGWDTISVKDGLADDKIVSIHKDKLGNFYFGTYGKGLSIFSSKGSMETVDMNSGLSNNSIWSILEDKSGKLYLATGKGINIITTDHPTKVFRQLNFADGLASSENNRDGSFLDSQGRLWFGTIAGASCYNPEYDKPVRIAPRLHLQNIELFGKPLDISQNEFNYNENFIDINYIGIYFPAPKEVTYRYRLMGLNDNFIETKERFARYTNLDPGSYTFEISAVNPWGFSSEISIYSFTIRPPFWATWWFRITVFLVLFWIFYSLYRQKINRIIQIERLRTSIAGDLHDEVGSSLTKIFMGAEMIQKSDDLNKVATVAGRIGKSSREMLQTFSDIIWGIEAQNDTIGDLTDRMEDFAHRMFSDKDVEINFEIDIPEPGKFIPGKKRQNIYLIFKEAINNILKHSDAQKITISFRKDRKSFELYIKDNGKADDTTGVMGGYGIKSMRQRAEELGGELKTELENGFSVRAIIPA